MAKKQEFYVDIDMKTNAVKNVKFETVTALPTENAFPGQVVEFEGVLQTYNGTKWVKYADDAQVQTNKSDIAGLKTTVGDSASGLVKTVNDLKSQIGTDESGNTLGSRVAALETGLGAASDEANAEGSAYARIAKNTADIATNATAASNAKQTADKAQADATAAKTKADSNETAIGNLQATTGTQTDDIAALKTTVGAKASGDVAATGLCKDVATNTATIAAVKATADAAAVKADVDTALSGKVDKVTGKGLSTNDYTTDEKNKLTGIAAGAQVNVIEAVKVDGTALTVTDKAVNIDLSGYAKKTELSSVYKVKGTLASVSELPASAEVGAVYNITAAFTDNGKNYPAGTNVVYVATDGDAQDGKWDALGGVTDLSAYAKTTEVTTAIQNAVKDKQATLTEAQLAAANSGINATKVTTYDGYADLITTAQETADAAKTAADGKVAKNADITADTACKITYDAKGLVTAGAALEVSDLPDKIPFSKTTGTLPLEQCPVVAVSKEVSATAGTALSVASGLAAALMAQVLDGNGNVVQCGIAISGGSVSLEFSEAFNGTVSIVGLR